MVRDPLEKHAIQSGEVMGDAASAQALLEKVHGSMPPWVERGAQFRDSEQNKKYLKDLKNFGRNRFSIDGNTGRTTFFCMR